jgi:hypothetical protein
MFNPEWIDAAADVAAVVEKGVAMRNRKQAEAAATPAPPSPTVVVNGISRDDFLMGVLIMAGAVLVLAAAMLAGAAIVHHGLTA